MPQIRFRLGELTMLPLAAKMKQKLSGCIRGKRLLWACTKWEMRWRRLGTTALERLEKGRQLFYFWQNWKKTHCWSIWCSNPALEENWLSVHNENNLRTCRRVCWLMLSCWRDVESGRLRSIVSSARVCGRWPRQWVSRGRWWARRHMLQQLHDSLL